MSFHQRQPTASRSTAGVIATGATVCLFLGVALFSVRRDSVAAGVASAAAVQPAGGIAPPSSPSATHEPPRDDQRRRLLNGLPTTLPSDDEWAEIGQFMDEHSPTRWRLAQPLLSATAAIHADLPKRLLYKQYLDLRQIQDSDSDEFERRVKQIELEDQIFEAETRLRDAETRQSADVPELRATFEARVKEHFSRELDAKEAKINRLETQIQQQRAALMSERQHFDETLQRRIEVARRLSDWFRNWATGAIKPFGRGPRDPARTPDDSPAPGQPSLSEPNRSDDPASR